MEITNEYSSLPNLKSTVASTVASRVVSTTASTTAFTSLFSNHSTTASTTASNEEKESSIIEIFGNFFDDNHIDALEDKNSLEQGFLIKNKSEFYEDTSNIYNKTCDKLEISTELRPTLEIEFRNELYTLSPNGDVQITEILNDDKGSPFDMGYYNSDTHTIRLYADSYDNGTCKNIKELISHELYHAKEAIKRNCIPQCEKDELVKEVLKNYIQKGEHETIINGYKDSNYKVMKSPVMNAKMREKYLEFAEKNLFSDNDLLLNDLQEYYHLKYVSKDNKSREIELGVKLASVLAQLEEIRLLNPEYKQQNRSMFTIGRNTIEERKELLQYAIAIESRYHLFRKKEISKDLPENKSFNKSEILSSIEANISSVQGNVALDNARKEITEKRVNNFLKSRMTRDEFNQYYYSEEEVNARKESYQQHITNLTVEHKEGGLNFLQRNKEIFATKRKMTKDKLLSKSYKLKRELRNNPEQIGLRAQCFLSDLDANKETYALAGFLACSVLKYVL